LKCGISARGLSLLVLSKNVHGILNIFVQAALRAAQQTQSGRDEDIAALRVEIQVVLNKTHVFP